MKVTIKTKRWGDLATYYPTEGDSYNVLLNLVINQLFNKNFVGTVILVDKRLLENFENEPQQIKQDIKSYLYFGDNTIMIMDENEFYTTNIFMEDADLYIYTYNNGLFEIV